MTTKPRHLVALPAVNLFGVFSCLLLAQTMPTTGSGKNQIQFNEIMVADVIGRNLESGGIYTYRSKDGVNVTRSILTFRSPELASREFDSMVRRAAKIMDQSRPSANEGITRRSVLLLKSSGKLGTTNAAVVRLSAMTLEKFESSSVKYALALEKQVDLWR
jgi:hypothetical protein